LLLGAAGGFGFILAIGLVLMWEQIRQGFRNLSEYSNICRSLASEFFRSKRLQPVSLATTSLASRAARYALDLPNSPYAKSLQRSARDCGDPSESRNDLVVIPPSGDQEHSEQREMRVMSSQAITG